jgi:glycerophosphoryl diester phosphodiesterase
MPRHGENTCASFRKALDAGANGLEFDVRRCRDGQIVVIHDETIDRTTNGRGRVRDLTFEQLRQFDAGAGENIPLLTDVLDQFGSRCLLNIELKDSGMAVDVKKLVLDRRLEKTVIVSSFEWEELEPFPREIPIALLSSRSRGLTQSAKSLGASAIHPRRDIVTRRLIDSAHDAKLLVYVWTVNDSVELAYFREMGVDGIFTDFPERCIRST